MDIFRNIRNDTFGYGGITAKRSKHRKYHDWWFVPLTIADIQVPSTIHIIQLFNCYTSETKNYICWKFPQSWRCCLLSRGSEPVLLAIASPPLYWLATLRSTHAGPPLCCCPRFSLERIKLLTMCRFEELLHFDNDFESNWTYSGFSAPPSSSSSWKPPTPFVHH